MQNMPNFAPVNPESPDPSVQDTLAYSYARMLTRDAMWTSRAAEAVAEIMGKPGAISQELKQKHDALFAAVVHHPNDAETSRAFTEFRSHEAPVSIWFAAVSDERSVISLNPHYFTKDNADYFIAVANTNDKSAKAHYLASGEIHHHLMDPHRIDGRINLVIPTDALQGMVTTIRLDNGERLIMKYPELDRLRTGSSDEEVAALANAMRPRGYALKREEDDGKTVFMLTPLDPAESTERDLATRVVTTGVIEGDRPNKPRMAASLSVTRELGEVAVNSETCRLAGMSMGMAASTEAVAQHTVPLHGKAFEIGTLPEFASDIVDICNTSPGYDTHTPPSSRCRRLCRPSRWCSRLENRRSFAADISRLKRDYRLTVALG